MIYCIGNRCRRVAVLNRKVSIHSRALPSAPLPNTLRGHDVVQLFCGRSDLVTILVGLPIPRDVAKPSTLGGGGGGVVMSFDQLFLGF